MYMYHIFAGSEVQNSARCICGTELDHDLEAEIWILVHSVS